MAKNERAAKTEDELAGADIQGDGADGAEKAETEAALAAPAQEFKKIELGRDDVHHGLPGEGFHVTRTEGGFGVTVGTLVIDGVIVPTTQWNDGSVKGVMPRRCRLGSKLTLDTADGLTRFEGRVKK